MMATTHVFAGLAVAAVVAVSAPEFAPVAAVAAIAGGVVPDLDLPAAHRRTLHFPVYYSALALAAGAVALVAPSSATVGVALFAVAAAVHCLMDALGCGLEPRPWEATSDEAVYSHYHGRWIAPRRWVRYDGAPEDLALAAVLAVPGLVVFDGAVRTLLVALLAVSAGYALVRKPLAWLAERAVAELPAEVVARVPLGALPLEEGVLDEEALENGSLEGEAD